MKESNLCTSPTSPDCLETVMNSFPNASSAHGIAVGFLFASMTAFLIYALIASYKSWGAEKIDNSELVDRIIMSLAVYCFSLIIIAVI